MEQIASSGSPVKIEVCDECGQPLGDKSMAVYDGENWRNVHASCAPSECKRLTNPTYHLVVDFAEVGDEMMKVSG
jgi:hypothetical protein